MSSRLRLVWIFWHLQKGQMKYFCLRARVWISIYVKKLSDFVVYHLLHWNTYWYMPFNYILLFIINMLVLKILSSDRIIQLNWTEIYL